jgi:3-oxoacyl-(acyl-carrier-protein) synthase
MAELGLKSTVVSRIAHFDVSAHHCESRAASLHGLSRFVQLGATAGAMAAEDAGLPSFNLQGLGGVIFSSAIGGTPEFQTAYEELSAKGTRPIGPVSPTSRLYDSVFLNYVPSWLGRVFGLDGPCMSLTTGCTAGIDALGCAFELVRNGDISLAIVGASEAPLCGLSYATLDVIGSLSSVNCPPEHASRPFDARRAGFVLGEAAAAVVIEDAEHARQRRVQPYAELCGFSSLNNAFHMSDLAEDGDAMAEVIRAALDDAALAPRDIDYINAHGSSTPQNDVFETSAIKTVFGTRGARNVPISSTKSMIGHSLSCASLVGIIAAVGALRYSVVPPTINQEVPDPACDLDYVANYPRFHEMIHALVMASGFGGIHSAAVLRRVGKPDPLLWAELADDLEGARDGQQQ